MKRLIVISIYFLLVSYCVVWAQCDTLSLLFTGDVLLDRGVRRQIACHGVKWLFDSVSEDFKRVDATIINLECPITDVSSPVSKQFVFRADTSCAEALASVGITHAALANNHSVDQGSHGLDDTQLLLSKVGICTLGYGSTPEQRLEPAVIEKGGVRVAVFNDITVPIENWLPSATVRPNVCNVPVDTLAEAIKRYHSDNPDVHIVAFLHWGVEYMSLPTFQQRREAAKLVSVGAEAIIGAHPHVTQPMCLQQGVPVYYSLGNFVFDGTRPHSDEAQMVVLTFDIKGLKDHKAIPVKIVSCQPRKLRQ